MKHVVITGGAGFVGSHLCERFLKEGYAVTAVDNFLTGRRSNLSDIEANANFQFVEHDVSKPFDETLFPFIKKHGLDGLLHFACPASPIDFQKIPFDILAVDSVGTMLTTDLALRFNARYLLASTSEVYGDPLVHPQKEDYWGHVNPTGERACYDEAKRFAEAYVTSMVRGNGTYQGKPYSPLNAGIVRIFNTYGPRMRLDDGRVVPQLCSEAMKGDDLSIHGDGKQTRSFCFVSDLVDGIFRLFESKERDPVNIGNPVERSILDFAETVIQLTGQKSKMRFTPARPDDPKRRCPDITRAKEILKWEPRVSLEEGLKKTIESFKSAL